MPVTVRIAMVGLNALVRKDGTVYTLLPNTDAHEHAARGQARVGQPANPKPMVAHKARLFLGPTKLDGGGPVGTPFDIERCILRVGGTQAPGTKDGELPKLLFNIRTVKKADPAPETLDDNPPAARVTARVDLALRGTFEAENPEEYLLKVDDKDPGKTVVIASFWRWTGVVEGETGPALELIHLADDGTQTKEPLTAPVREAGAGNLVSDLSIFHVPENEMPTGAPIPVPEHSEVLHIRAYDSLFDAAKNSPRLFTMGKVVRGTASGCNGVRIER